MADAVEDAVLELVEATREWHGPPKGAARGRRGAAVEAMLDEAFGLVHALGSKKAGVRRRRTRREEESRRPSPGQACVRLVVRAAKARLAPGARGEERERERERERSSTKQELARREDRRARTSPRSDKGERALLACGPLQRVRSSGGRAAAQVRARCERDRDVRTRPRTTRCERRSGPRADRALYKRKPSARR